MNKKRVFIIGTATTPKKQQAIRKAREGLLDTSSYEYAKSKWRSALFHPLRNRMHHDWWTDNDVWDFTDECINDAFNRIKEYNPEYRFRTFLVEIIIKPKLDKLYKTRKQKPNESISYNDDRFEEKPIELDELEDEIKPNMEKELARDILRKLKAEDETKYEVFCYREFDNWEYKDIADELKITESNARQIYNRVKKGILPELFSKISNSNKYIDKDLKIRDDILLLLKSDIKRK